MMQGFIRLCTGRFILEYPMTHTNAWPSLPYGEWAPTKKTFHMVGQMVGKVRLALAPAQPEWFNACLYLDGRGFTTGAMPHGDAVVSIGIDVYDSVIAIEVSDGRRRTVPLPPDRSVADIWRVPGRPGRPGHRCRGAGAAAGGR